MVGLNEYSSSRAGQLAESGHISMTLDVFGNGKTAEDSTSAQNLAMPFYKNPALAKKLLDPAIDILKTYPQTDETKIAAIGYCFGGFVVLNATKPGADLKGVVSFHGSLGGVNPEKDLLKAKILVCHGAEDPMTNPDVEEFKKGMDCIGADYTFKVYHNATHAFSNPNATAKGKKYNMPIKYNQTADKASRNDMKEFFQKIF